MHLIKREAPVEAIRARAYTIPTDRPEANGTYAWTSTTLVVVEVTAAGKTGIGYTYNDATTAHFIEATLAPTLIGGDAWNINALWKRMQQRVRGTEPSRDPHRVAVAREAIGDGAGLFVDANGALDRKQALSYAEQFAQYGVEWFEEPVSSDDITGLALLRDALPAHNDLAAGEYGYTLDDFRARLTHNAVDVLQADVTRCGGITGFLRTATLCDAFHIPLSAHCAPALHLHVACAAPRLRHQEWFHDHVRIESMLFDGAPHARDGAISPDWSRPGCGLDFKHADAHRYAV
ncbi:enolase C-terminal domain-like protein [Caballeronia grimmiae]|uniref:enolase C-terminal domain-like protein n=1 Tax=Caballeronia grimmiae TaxID=1071679 RepID=UPI0038B7957E